MSELKPLPSMQDDPSYVAPDSFDLTLASKIILSTCPFCGSKSPRPLGSAEFKNGGFKYRIQCGQFNNPWCFASVWAWDHTRAEARLGAVKAWERRGGVLAEDNRAVRFTEQFNEKEQGRE